MLLIGLLLQYMQVILTNSSLRRRKNAIMKVTVDKPELYSLQIASYKTDDKQETMIHTCSL